MSGKRCESAVCDDGGNGRRVDGGVRMVARSRSVRGGDEEVCLQDREDGGGRSLLVVVGCRVGCAEVVGGMAVGSAVEGCDIVVVVEACLDALLRKDEDILDTPPCNLEKAVAVAVPFVRHFVVSAARQAKADTEAEGNLAVEPPG